MFYQTFSFGFSFFNNTLIESIGPLVAGLFLIIASKIKSNSISFWSNPPQHEQVVCS